jgi:hypothetical protein
MECFGAPLQWRGAALAGPVLIWGLTTHVAALSIGTAFIVLIAIGVIRGERALRSRRGDGERH